MNNRANWKPNRFVKKNGKIEGAHVIRLIGRVYDQMIQKYATGLLADIGCGDVPYYELYKDKITDNVCVDWGNSVSVSFIDHFADLNKPLNFFESNSFDTILCTDVLEHIHEPALLFSEMARVLKPHGNLILGVPFLYWVHDNPHDYNRYTHFMLEEFCKKNGLTVVELEIYGGLPEILFDLVEKGYNYYKLPLPKVFNKCFNGFGKFMSKRAFIKRMSIRSRPTFPMGYVLVARKSITIVD